MILKPILLTKIAPWMPVVLWDLPNMPGKPMGAVAGDAPQAAVILPMGLLYLRWRRFETGYFFSSLSQIFF